MLYLFKFCLPFLILSSYKVNCDHVPVVLWNIKGSSAPSRSVSAFEVSNDKSMQEFLHVTLKDGFTTMLVYVEDKLSNEDLTPDAFKDIQGNSLKTVKALLGAANPVIFPSVKEPVRHFRDVNCGVKDIHVAKHGENLDKVLSNAVENSCVVIVHLGNKGLADGKPPVLHSTKKNVIGAFTGSKSSWHPMEESHRRTRSLLADLKPEPSHFINFTGCIIMYADNVTLSVGENSVNDSTFFAFPPSKVEGQCGNETSTLELTFDETKESVQMLLKLNFKRAIGSWIIQSAEAEIKGKKGVPENELNLHTSVIDVPTRFSYSCGAYVMQSKNFSNIKITIDRFQIQPFDVSEKFDRSFDCVPFFTLPIWMGIFVGLLFIMILNSGIYALFNIKTMDRFDDPKGKTITVPVGGE